MKRLLIRRIVAKECPTCKKANFLSTSDLIRSFYLRTPYENLVARHYCHYCHSGWNIKGLWAAMSVIYLFTGYIFLADLPDVLKLTRTDNVLRNNDVLHLFGLLVFLVISFLIIDFIIKTFLVSRLRAVKQTG